MFSTFSLFVYIKCFLKKTSVNATDMTYPKSAPAETYKFVAKYFILWISSSCRTLYKVLDVPIAKNPLGK